MRKVIVLSVAFFLMLTGCQPMGSGTPKQQSTPNLQTTHKTPQLLHVEKNTVEGNHVTIHTRPISESEAKKIKDESVLDIHNPDAIHDYVTYEHPDAHVEKITVLNGNQKVLSFQVKSDNRTRNQQISTITENATVTSIQLPPPGVTIDKKITPLAPLNASRDEKVNALRRIGESKLGVKYVWGHNEDRGQTGFDCSNYVEYVYHHALGYLFTTSSRKQYSSVGVPVSINQMQAGDLVAFNNGGHVGIYMGNGQMIQMGGGTGQCSYLPLKPGSYWYKHLSAVKRMF